MQSALRVIAALALANVVASSAVTPVQKVIQLMQGMLEQGKKEKHDERVQFAAFKQFCEDTSAAKQVAIDNANEKIDMLKADIAKYISDADRLGKEVAAHDEDISIWKGDVKAATTVRGIEKSDYDATHKDYSESVSAIQRAIEVLKKQAYNRKQASFVQVSALTKLNLIPADAKRTLNIFLQQDPADQGLAVSAPEANGYDFQSQGVIDMLEKLLDKFSAEREVLEKEEMNSVYAFKMLMQDLNAQITQATTERNEKAEAKAKTLQAKADAEGDLTDTTTTRDADQVYLTDLVATCEQKATDFASRTKLRVEELEAVQKAIDIVSSNAVAGNAEEHLHKLALEQVGSSLAFLDSQSSQQHIQERVAQFLQKRAQQLQSKMLATLAQKVGSDPFMKVKKMLKDLIVRLMEEANEEAEHKGWCDTELSTNEKTRQEKTQAVETLHAEIDQLEASLSKLSEDITTLTKDVADLDGAMAKATKLRAEEKATNTETIKDSMEAQTAVAAALVVLNEFYAKAGEATALLQQQPEAPEIFDSPYKGMQAENGGVVGMLEVIQSDFARLESDTKSAEASAQDEYARFMTDSKVDRARMSSDIEHKEAKKQDEEQALVTKKGDLEGNQKELDAALGYFEKLKPSCIDSGVTYEDRVGRRKEEIESLQDALRILNGEDIA